MDRADHLGQPMMAISVSAMTSGDADEWAAMRHDLWPGHSVAEFQSDIAQAIADPSAAYVAIARIDGMAVGFIETSLRTDYVNGCKTSPVAFLEGIYVHPNYRRRGVAAALVASAQEWARQTGCTEFASDASIDNLQSHALHRALGFEETQRVVYFRKLLP